jgi:hypothetical protein
MRFENWLKAEACIVFHYYLIASLNNVSISRYSEVVYTYVWESNLNVIYGDSLLRMVH